MNSFLLFPGGTSNQLAYANFATTGNVTATYSAGLITLALTGGPSFTGATTFPVGSNAVLQLASGGGQSAVAITSAGSGGSSSLAVTSTATSGVPLTLSDFQGGGVDLKSNGQIAFVEASQTTMTTDYLEAMASPSGTGANPQLQAAGPDSDINLTLSAKGGGVIVGTSTLDLQANAITAEFPVDAGCGTVTANTPVFLVTGGTSLSVHSLSSTMGCGGVMGQAHGYLGIAVLTRTTGQTAVVATGGELLCKFDATSVVAGDYVAVSAGIGAGSCHDTGTLATAAPPAATGMFGQVIGIIVSSTVVSTSNFLIFIKPVF